MIGSRGRSLGVTIDEPTKVGEARRRASALAALLDFDETRQGRVAIIVAEAASNLIKHAGGGELLLQEWGWGESERWLEIQALDRGPGMSDVGRCMADGYSTAGSLGHGLGSIARLSDAYGIYSLPGCGTALWVRLYADSGSRAVAEGRPELGAVNLPAPGEEACGDDWTLIQRDGQRILLVVERAGARAFGGGGRGRGSANRTGPSGGGARRADRSGPCGVARHAGSGPGHREDRPGSRSGSIRRCGEYFGRPRR